MIKRSIKGYPLEDITIRDTTDISLIRSYMTSLFGMTSLFVGGELRISKKEKNRQIKNESLNRDSDSL